DRRRDAGAPGAAEGPLLAGAEEQREAELAVGLGAAALRGDGGAAERSREVPQRRQEPGDTGAEGARGVLRVGVADDEVGEGPLARAARAHRRRARQREWPRQRRGDAPAEGEEEVAAAAVNAVVLGVGVGPAEAEGEAGHEPGALGRRRRGRGGVGALAQGV